MRILLHSGNRTNAIVSYCSNTFANLSDEFLDVRTMFTEGTESQADYYKLLQPIKRRAIRRKLRFTIVLATRNFRNSVVFMISLFNF